jgi:malate dehydrogenase
LPARPWKIAADSAHRQTPRPTWARRDPTPRREPGGASGVRTTVAGIPVQDLIPEARLNELIDRAKKGGIEIVNFLKTGSAYYAPAASVAQMIESIVKDQNRILPCSVLLDGEYGIHDTVVGVPVKLGRNCVEEVIELKLNDAEMNLLKTSSDFVHKNILECLELTKA